MNSEMTCPCGALSSYENCCGRFHKGQSPQSAIELMRSRWSAFALNLSHYIMDSTHPASPLYQDDRANWESAIRSFSQNTVFRKLEILDFQENDVLATVTFVAHLIQNGQDATFTERSYFRKDLGRWKYLLGQTATGVEPNLTGGPGKVMPLAYYGDRVLGRTAKPVKKITKEIRDLVQGMIETMDAYNGIGLAAPQVNRSIRVFVIRPVTIDASGKASYGDPMVFINPTLKDPSKELWKAKEGCLSLPTMKGEVERPWAITVEYTNLEGNIVSERFEGWTAREVQHENDHLEGRLYTDLLEEGERGILKPKLENLKRRLR